MKKLLASAAFVAMAVAAGGAHADNPQASTITAKGHVAASCTLVAPSTTTQELTGFATNGIVSTAQKTLDFGTITCNDDAKVKLSSAKGGLKRLGSAGTDCGAASADCVLYSAAAAWNSANATLEVAGSPVSGTEASSTGHSSAAISASLTPDGTFAGARNPGDFQDQLTVTVTPNN